MTISEIIQNLTEQRDRIDAAIRALQGLSQAPSPEADKPKRGRPLKSEAERLRGYRQRKKEEERPVASERDREKKRVWAAKKRSEVRANQNGTQVIKVQCPDCKDSFGTARAMGIHRTKVHFLQSSLLTSQLNPERL